MRRRHCLIYLVLKKNEKEKFFFADSVSDIFSMVLYKEEIGKSLFEKKPQMKMNSKKKTKKHGYLIYTWSEKALMVPMWIGHCHFYKEGRLLSQFFSFIYSHSSLHSFTLTVLFIQLLSQFFSFIYSHSSFHLLTLTVLFIHLLSQFFSFIYSHSSFHSITLTVLFIHLLSQFFSFIYSHSSFHSHVLNNFTFLAARVLNAIQVW